MLSPRCAQSGRPNGCQPLYIHEEVAEEFTAKFTTARRAENMTAPIRPWTSAHLSSADICDQAQDDAVAGAATVELVVKPQMASVPPYPPTVSSIVLPQPISL
jgi:hypothetical protein